MKQPHMQVAQVLMKGAGFYSWCLRENSLTADKAFAQIYEIDEGELARGVPVEFILERIVEEDRPRLAARIHEVILGGEPLVSPFNRVSQRTSKISSEYGLLLSRPGQSSFNLFRGRTH